jgi:uncharacterized membrane-anchored protein
MSQIVRLILISAGMTAFLVGMVVDHHVRRSTGTEILLDLEPVDPRDLLAGYYVIISTPLHSVDPEQVGGEADFERSADIYVVVEPDGGGSWQPVSIHSERPAAGIFVHGKVQWAGPDTIRAHFNLERYYADAETAQALEIRQQARRESLRLIVSVGSDGRAIIRGLEIDGERVEDSLL